MKKTSILKLVTVIAMVAIVLACIPNNKGYAASINAINGTSIENSGGNGTGNTLNKVNNTSNNASNNATNNTANNSANNTPVNNTTLPDTGAESSIGIVVLIALTSVSAIYTYIKVREYNI